MSDQGADVPSIAAPDDHHAVDPEAVRVSIVGGDVPVRVLAAGTLIEETSVLLRVRLDEGNLDIGDAVLIAIVHRSPAELVLASRADGETDAAVARLVRSVRPPKTA